MDERYAMYSAHHKHPVLTTVALSRRLNREGYGPYERAPTWARVVAAALDAASVANDEGLQP